MSSPGDGGGSRLSELRGASKYKTSTMLMSVLLLIVVIGAAVAVAVSRNDDPADTTPQSVPTGTGAPSAQTAPSGPTALPDNAFGIPTTDQHGRRVETPTNPLGQVLPQSSVSSPRSTTSTQSPTAASGEGMGEGLVAAPEGLMWQRVYGEPLPFSTSDGPTAISADGVPTGFSHTRQGAVLAAWQIGQRATWAPDAQNRALFDRAAVISAAARPDVETMLTNEAQFNAATPGIPPGAFDVPIAVRVPNYADDYTHVDIAVPTPPDRVDGVVAVSFGLDMVWRDGTWKWVVPPAGVAPGGEIASLDGWSTW